MAPSRAFKNLATLRDNFMSPMDDETLSTSGTIAEEAIPHSASSAVSVRPENTLNELAPHHHQIHAVVQPAVEMGATPKVDRRRLRKVLKTPATKITAHVRLELYEDVNTMIFARKTTWIAVLDELLQKYVTEAKASNRFPK